MMRKHSKLIHFFILSLGVILGACNLGFAQTWSELDAQGRAALVSQQYSKALTFFEKARGQAVKEFGKNSYNYIATLEALGGVYRKQVLKNKALVLYQELNKIYRARLASFKQKHPDLVAHFKSLKSVDYTYVKLVNDVDKSLVGMDQYAKSEKLYDETMLLAKKASAGNAALLNTWQQALSMHQMFDRDLKLYETFVQSQKKKLGETHPNYMRCAGILQSLYIKNGLTGKGAQLMLELGLIGVNKFKVTDPVYLKSANDLGIYYSGERQYDKAAEMYLKAANAYKQTNQEQNIMYISGVLISLADVYVMQKQYDKAIETLNEQLRLFKKYWGQVKSMQLEPLKRLAKVYELKKDLSKAEETYQQLLSNSKLVHEHNYNLNSIDFAKYCFRQKKYTQAETILEKVLPKIKPIYESKSSAGQRFVYGSAIELLAAACAAQQKYQKAKSLYIEAIPFYIDYVKASSQFGLKYDMLRVRKQATDLNEDIRIDLPLKRFEIFVFEYHKKHPQSSSDLLTSFLNLRLFIKSRLLNTNRNIQMLLAESTDPRHQKLQNRYKMLKNQMVAMTNLQPAQQQQMKATMHNLNGQIFKIEQEFLMSLGGDASSLSSFKYKDIVQVLAPDEAAIEVVRREQDKKISYEFLVVTKQSPFPFIVTLNQPLLESTYISEYQKAIQAKRLDKLSYERYWKPVAQLLKNKGITKVYFSPDGAYHKLNLATLYNTQTKQYLVEELDLVTVTNLKDILRHKHNNKKIDSKLVSLFGRPNYQMPIAELKKAEQAFAKGRTTQINSLGAMSAKVYASGKQTLRSGWADLPGTEAEIKAIAQVLKQKTGLRVQTSLGNSALELAVKNVKQPKILHIATHGFFVERFKAPTKVEKEEVIFDNFSRGNKNAMLKMKDSLTRELPMLRSGVILAGVSSYEKAKDKPATEDGVLTAYEAAQMNLHGTELVVLSACETGLGEISNGEGVYGLQRAFMVAGARALLMSLWKVDDQATEMLMREFYKEWIGKGKSKRVALKAAQQYLRTYQKAGKAIYASPYYWGAFVMVGE